MNAAKTKNPPHAWNYRLVKEEGELGVMTYYIAEVYYSVGGTPEGWCDAGSPCGDTPAEVMYTMTMMKNAFSKPLLIVKDNKLVEVEQ